MCPALTLTQTGLWMPCTLSRGDGGRFGTIHFGPALMDPALDLGN